MKKAILTFLLTATYSINTCCCQTTNTTQVLEDLKKAKQEAINKEDYVKAAEIKAQIDAIESNQSKIDALQIELNKKLKEEDYTGAAMIKEEIQKLKDHTNSTDVQKNNATVIVKSNTDNLPHVSDKIEINNGKYYYKGVFMNELGVWQIAEKINDQKLSLMVKKNKGLKSLNRSSAMVGLPCLIIGAALTLVGATYDKNIYDNKGHVIGSSHPYQKIIVPGVCLFSMGAVLEFGITSLIKHSKRKRNKIIINNYNALVSN